MTPIIVRHKSSDFLRLALYAAGRSSTLRWTAFVVAVLVFAINVYQTRAPWEPLALIATLLTTALFVFGYFILSVVLTVLSALLRNRGGSPAAEVQTYLLTELGLSRNLPRRSFASDEEYDSVWKNLQGLARTGALSKEPELK